MCCVSSSIPVCRQPLCLREAGATGAAGGNQSYPQQQILWPLWVSTELHPQRCLENRPWFSFLASVLSGQGLTQVIEKAETTLGIPSPTELSAQVEGEQGEWRHLHARCQWTSPYLVNLAVYRVFCSAAEACSDTGVAATDGSAAVGGAMGMLTSLTSVVQSTVSNGVSCLWRWKGHVFIIDAYQIGKFSCAKLFKIRLIQSHRPADILRTDEF